MRRSAGETETFALTGRLARLWEPAQLRTPYGGRKHPAATTSAPETDHAQITLNARKLEVLRLVVQGLTNKEIATMGWVASIIPPPVKSSSSGEKALNPLVTEMPRPSTRASTPGQLTKRTPLDGDSETHTLKGPGEAT